MKGKLKSKVQTFRVWAPLAKKASVHIVQPVNKISPMKKDPSGYFNKTFDDLNGTVQYYYSIDGGEALPDPASHFQPEGVMGPSEKIDHDTFKWTDGTWRGLDMRELIIYELHVGTFTPEGTFDAMIPRLKDLVDLGINAIEVMPVSQFPGGRNWGYDGVFPYAVQNTYGGSEGLKKFVNACHLSGIAVILDVVYNHFGPEGNVFPKFGPYLTDAYHVPWGKAVNFDQQWSDGVRDFVINNVTHWFVNYHIDGLRLDAIHAIFDSNGKHILREINEQRDLLKKQTGRQFFTIAESDLNDAKVVRHKSVGGYDFDAQWLDDFHHALYVLVHPQGLEYYVDFGRLEQLAKALSHGFVFSGEYVSFRKRRFGSPSGDVQPERFIVFNQNHDQVGNRVDGHRLSRLVNVKGIKLAAAVMLLSPYIPMLFMGEEYGETAPFLYFISHSDPELIKAVREGRKKEFAAFHNGKVPPDAADPGTFSRCILQWKTHNKGKNLEILQWYKWLLALRKSHKALRNTSRESVHVSIVHSKALMMLRESKSEQLCCLFNFSNKNITVNLAEGVWHTLATTSSRVPPFHGSKSAIRNSRLRVGGMSAVVLSSAPGKKES